MPTLTALAVAVLLVAATACRPGALELGVGVDEEERTIAIGMLAAMTGPLAALGVPLTRGHEVYFAYVNQDLGGVGRHLPAEERLRVELVIEDTRYRTDDHREAYAVMREQVLMISQSFGTPTTAAILDSIREDGILTGPATLATAWLRERSLFPAGAPYPVQFINAAQHLADEDVAPRAGIIYQDDEYGREGRAGLEFAARQLGFEIIAEATYELGETEFLPHVQTMQHAGADHVFLASVPMTTAAILGAGAGLGYRPLWIGLSPAWGSDLLRSPLLPYLEQTLWIASDASCPWGVTDPGCEAMAEMVANFERFGGEQEPDLSFQFGYTQARIAHQILERAVELGVLTREGIIAAFESLRDVDMGGLLNPVSYGPTCEEKLPSLASTIWRVNPEVPVGLAPVATLESEIAAGFEFC